MHIAGVGRGAIGEQGAAIGRPAKREHALMSQKAVHAQAVSRGALRFKVLNELTHGSLEKLALGRREAPPITEKVLTGLVRWH